MASYLKSTLLRSRRIASCFMLGSCFVLTPPCWAGRDAGQMIAQDKANQEVVARRHAAQDDVATAPEAESEVLPLDHGPRATTTPWLNAQRRLRARAAAASAASASEPAVASGAATNAKQ